MLFIFDLDGTLISSYMDSPKKRYDDWQVSPGRGETLAALRAAGHTIAIATNQAGVAFSYVTESHARRKIASAITALGLPAETPVAVCFAHPQARSFRYRQPAELARRKPHGAMLRELMVATDDRENAIYIGDKVEDRQAARDAGVRFTWASDFFDDEHP